LILSVAPGGVAGDKGLVLLWGINSLGGAGVCRDDDGVAVFQDAKLFEDLGSLQGGGCERLVDIQEWTAIGIQTDVAEQALLARAAGAMVGYGATAEVEGPSGLISDNFDNGWV